MRVRLALLASVVLALLVPVGASAHPMPVNSWAVGLGGAAMALTHGDPVDDAGAMFTASDNMRLLSFSERRAGADQFAEFNSDLAFWGDKAYQGTFKGFRIIDIDDPRNPVELIDYEQCGTVGQGDVVIWGTTLVRSWDVNSGAGQSCGGQPVPVGFEGLHVFDVSDPGAPVLKASIDLACGSHTASGLPDLKNRRLIVYSTPSSGTCEGIDIVEVPLSAPEKSQLIGFEQSDPKRPPGTVIQGQTNPSFACHDTGIILGRAMKAACAGGAGFAVWSIGGKDGGTLDDPRFLYNHVLPEIAFGPPNANEGPTGHSASFSWDGETIIFGHEPGGGFDPRCMKTGEDLPDRPEVAFQNENQKSFFFFDTESGAPKGQWAFNSRPQSGTENCTLHNYNIVPTAKDDILVHGSYQSGVGVLDFSDTRSAREIAYADPAPLVPPQLGGDWSSYFYNGYIYESDITRGLYAWKLKDRDVKSAIRLRHLNPQTQEFTIGAKHDHDRWDHKDRWKGND